MLLRKCQAKKMAQWLPWAKYWYNTSFHTTTRMTPFEAVHGPAPAIVHTYEHGTTTIAQVEHSLKKRDELLKLLKEDNPTSNEIERRLASMRAGLCSGRFCLPQVITISANVYWHQRKYEVVSTILWAL